MNEKKSEKDEEKANLKGDYGNMASLFGLYFMQGVVSGLVTAVPILLQNRGVSYKEQALFTIAYYPFSREKKTKSFKHFLII